MDTFIEKLPLIVAFVLLVLLILFYYLRKKKYNDQMDKMQKELKKGQKIVTYSGIVGTILEVKENEFGKYFIIQTGGKDQYGYIEVDSRSIYGPIEKNEIPNAKKGEPKKEIEEKAPEIKKNETKNNTKSKKTSTKSKAKK